MYYANTYTYAYIYICIYYTWWLPLIGIGKDPCRDHGSDGFNPFLRYVGSSSTGIVTGDKNRQNHQIDPNRLIDDNPHVCLLGPGSVRFSSQFWWPKPQISINPKKCLLRPSSIGMLVYQRVPRFWKPSPSFSSMIFQPATFDYQKVKPNEKHGNPSLRH